MLSAMLAAAKPLSCPRPLIALGIWQRTEHVGIMEQQGAALPWGAAQQQQQVEEVPVVPDLPASMGLGLGSRVEVLWEVTDEDGEQEPCKKWWGAELSRRCDGQTDGEGRAVYVLRYDPNPEQGFPEPEECSVSFLEEHYLYDLGADDELPWRREGEAWEAPPPPAGSGEEGAPHDGEVLFLADIAADIRKGERRRGRTLDEDAAEMLAELPQEQQMVIAAGFRSFADHLTAAIAKLTEQHGPDYVVTAADVQAATAAAKAALQP